MKKIGFLHSKIVAAAIAAGLAAPSAMATTRFVSLCGQDAWLGVQPNCAAPLGPKRTIQAAIDASVNGDTVNVMPGTYLETIDLDGKAISIIGLGGPDNTTIDGNGSGPVVTCNSFEGPNTVLQGLRITGADITGNGGGMLNVWSSPTIINCRFTSNQTDGNGAAMENVQASPTITNCTFSFNEAGQEPPGAGKGRGGAIHAIGGTITVSNCNFYNNDGTGEGGVISLFSSAILNLEGCDFFINGSLNYGLGGGIYADHSTVTVEDSIMTGCYATRGGAVMAVNASDIQFINTTLNQNSSSDPSGGAVSLTNSTSNFFACDFIDNHGFSGGAIYANGGTMLVTFCSFQENESENFHGGAIYLEGAEATITLSSFTNNIGKRFGGAIGSLDSSLTLDICTFDSNIAQENDGGAIWSQSGFLSADGCTFESNFAAADGGAIDLSFAPAGTSITDCTFTGNECGYNGGGLYSWTPLILENCTFTSNLAHVGGGGAYNVGGGAVIRQCQFENNTAETLSGGGLNIQGSAQIVGCLFTGNSAVYGGGAAATGNAHPIYYGCRFEANTASQEGAALAVNLSSSATLVNCIINDNIAPFNGGAIREATNAAKVRIINCAIVNNSGGGVRIVNPGTTSLIANTVIWNNINGPAIGGDMPMVRSSNVQGGAAGIGNLNMNPMFANAAIGNYHLAAGSPCIDAGNNWALPADFADLDSDLNTLELTPRDYDGNPRFTDNPRGSNSGCGGMGGAKVDIGPFETAGAPPAADNSKLGDINGDGQVDTDDLLSVINAWGICPVGTCCPADFDMNGVINVDDLLVVINHWG